MNLSEFKGTKTDWTLETVKTSVGICHKIGPFPGGYGREIGHACIYVDGSNPQSTDPAAIELLANARMMAASKRLAEACVRQQRLIEALQRLLVAYRTGGRPSDATLDDVSKAAEINGSTSAALAAALGKE